MLIEIQTIYEFIVFPKSLLNPNMITLKTKLDYKQYFLGNFYKMTRGIVDRLFLVFFFGGGIFYILQGSIKSGVIFAAIPFVFLFSISFLKYAYARIYLKMDHIEYFFDTQSFGYKIGDYKVEFKKSTIKKISFGSRYIFIQIPKQSLYFIGRPDKVSSVKKSIESSDYEKFIT